MHHAPIFAGASRIAVHVEVLPHLHRTIHAIKKLGMRAGVAINPSTPAGMLEDEWAQQFLNQWSIRTGGGTDQIQRNVIGERTLALPVEPRVDKAIPFREIGKPRGTAR